VAMGDPARQLQALQAGAIDGAALALPYSVLAVREGFRAWVRTDTLYRAVNTGLVASQRRIDEQRAEVLRLLRAENAAIRFMKTHRDAGIALLARRLEMEPDVAAQVYDGVLEGYPEEPDLEKLRDALEAVIAIERATVGAEVVEKDWADLVDTSLAREAAR
jgi:ABC-type nitrate/sulfonate/bicarbonate transport system substrate-binding protein